MVKSSLSLAKVNTYILSTIEAGFDIASLLIGRMPIKGVIGLKRPGNVHAIAGYVNAAEWCIYRGIPCLQAETYALATEQDRALIDPLEIDILLVIGWQRLVPDWLIKKCRVGVLGLHGSAHGIEAGRGRSPQNWALLLGHRRFSVSLFRIDSGIDSGPVLQTCSFPLTERDDIASSYAKVSWAAADMIVQCAKFPTLPDGTPQRAEGYYLPQRKEEDGEIDWHQSVTQIDAMIRALSRPYPGAYSRMGAGRLIIWRARPFDSPSLADNTPLPGTLVHILCRGCLIIRAGDGWLMVDEYQLEGSAALSDGTVFSSACHSELVARVIQRHYEKFPGNPIHPDIHRYQSPGTTSLPIA